MQKGLQNRAKNAFWALVAGSRHRKRAKRIKKRYLPDCWLDIREMLPSQAPPERPMLRDQCCPVCFGTKSVYPLSRAPCRDDENSDNGCTSQHPILAVEPKKAEFLNEEVHRARTFLVQVTRFELKNILFFYTGNSTRQRCTTCVAASTTGVTIRRGIARRDRSPIR